MSDRPSSKVTVEEASLCPKCGRQGILTKSNKTHDDRGRICDIGTYVCDNEECVWFNTGWLVQSDVRGNVYNRQRSRDGRIQKTFPAMTPDALAFGQRIMEDITEEDMRNRKEQNEGT